MTRSGLIKAEDWTPVGIAGLEDAAMEAVRASGNTLVTAGPGAGKTELLGQRGVFLLQTGVCPYPRRILAISYKRDAARNLRERFRLRCSKEQANRLDSLTFDAFAKSILDRFWRALPAPWQMAKPYHVALYTTSREFADFQRSAADSLNNDKTPAGWAAVYSGIKLSRNEVMALNLDAFNLAIQELSLQPLHIPNAAAFLQLAYIRRSFESRSIALTFPMIGRLAQAIVESNPQIRAAILATYSHVFLDEFQDATGVQYGLLKSVFGDSPSVITAVGDDKQKIMGWAGAHKNSFGVFTADFLKDGAAAGERHITLSLNYRSNARIVEILNTLKKRLAPQEPDFRAVRPAPDLPEEKICSVIVSPDSDTESEALATFIADLVKSGVAPRSIGLLVRQKAADAEGRLRPFFEKRGLALRNEDRLVDGASIQDLMTEPYAQIVTDMFDLLLRQRGGAVWVKVADQLSDMAGLSAEEDAEKVSQIIEKLDQFHKSNAVADPDKPAPADKIQKMLQRIEDFFGIEQLKASAPQYQQGDFFGRVRKSTCTFLQECSANASWLETIARYRGEGQIPLLTITKSKGLEYDVVILLGLDDEQWWSFPKNPDEGHATFFVAASRARERLFMTLCQGKPRGKIGDIYKLLTEAGVKGLKSEALVG